MTPVTFTAARFLGVITLSGSAWSIEFPDADFPKWLDFFKRMDDRYGKKTGSYKSALIALKGLDLPQ